MLGKEEGKERGEKVGQGGGQSKEYCTVSEYLSRSLLSPLRPSNFVRTIQSRIQSRDWESEEPLLGQISIISVSIF